MENEQLKSFILKNNHRYMFGDYMKSAEWLREEKRKKFLAFKEKYDKGIRVEFIEIDGDIKKINIDGALGNIMTQIINLNVCIKKGRIALGIRKEETEELFTHLGSYSE